MSGKVYLGTLIAIFLLGLLMGCDGSSSNQPSSTPSATVIAIKADGNAPQTTASGKPFGSPFSVTVTQNGIKVSGQKVTFAAPSSGASGTFANGTATDTEVTAVDGTATSSAFTANSTGGTYSEIGRAHV